MVAYSPDGTEIIYNLGWMAASMALVWIMIPGVGFFYSGLLQRKNALSMIWTSLASIVIMLLFHFKWVPYLAIMSMTFTLTRLGKVIFLGVLTGLQ